MGFRGEVRGVDGSGFLIKNMSVSGCLINEQIGVWISCKANVRAWMPYQQTTRGLDFLKTCQGLDVLSTSKLRLDFYQTQNQGFDS